MRWAVLTIAVIVLLARGARAQTSSPVAPQPGAELTVQLITMSPGSLIYERFGHNTIRVVDASRGTDILYNYGLFDFEQENFVWRFLHGRMLYSMAGEPIDILAGYGADNRTVWVQELDLTPAQRLALSDFLKWNARGENRDYRYDYYRDNCSTRVRDALDRVLGGALNAQLAGQMTDTTYRSHTRRLTSDNLLWFTAFTYVLGHPVDVPLTKWDECFVPMKLMEYVRGLTIVDEHGRVRPLVKREGVLYQATRPTAPEVAPDRMAGYLVGGVALGAALAGFATLAPRRRAARYAFALLALSWALLGGVGGAIAAYGWGVTDHTASYRNENLLQLSPLFLPLVVLLPPFAFGRRWGSRVTWILVLVVASLSALGLLLKVLPGFWQANGEIIALALPANLGLLWAVWRGRRPVAGAAPGAPAAAKSAPRKPARPIQAEAGNKPRR